MQLLACAQTKLTCTHGHLIIHTVDLWRKDRESKQQWSQPMREVCATRKACPCHEGEKSVSTLAQYKVCECSSQRTIQKEATQSLEEGGAQPRQTAKNPFSLSVPACISICLSTCLSLPQPVWGIFQLKAEEGKPPPVMLHPHPSLIQFALICREPH